MATEAEIELANKKRLDLTLLNDANLALQGIVGNPAGVEILLKGADGQTFSLNSLKNNLQAKGAQETTMVSEVESAITDAIGGTLVADTILKAVYDLYTAYQADIAAE